MGPLNRFTIDQSTVGTTPILQNQAITVAGYLGVIATDLCIFPGDIIFRVTTKRYSITPEQIALAGEWTSMNYHL
jgi:hypothetical protein